MNFQIEGTSHCDLECGYCPNRDMQRKRSFMAWDVWDTILTKYVGPYRHIGTDEQHPATLIPHKDGEPLLNKQYLAMLGRASELFPDIKIDIYSHGLMLPSWKKRGQDVFDFLANLPNKVRYLMSYHPFNHDGSVNDYTATNEYMRDLLRRRPKNVEVIMVSHLSKYTTREAMLEWKDSWNGYGITVHANVSINPWTGLIDDPNVSHFNGCPYADFGHWFFGVTGNVIACCLDLEEEIVLGNVMVDEPAEMFARTKAFYEAQSRREVKYAVCHNCYGLPPAPKLVQLGGMA